MAIWTVSDAETQFSEMLLACLDHGPQVVTVRGAEAAVLVPIDQWQRRQPALQPSLRQLLLSDFARCDEVAR